MKINLSETYFLGREKEFGPGLVEVPDADYEVLSALEAKKSPVAEEAVLEETSAPIGSVQYSDTDEISDTFPAGKQLKEAGLRTYGEVRELDSAALEGISGIGTKTALKIIEALHGE